jgi:hypothetical protein
LHGEGSEGYHGAGRLCSLPRRVDCMLIGMSLKRRNAKVKDVAETEVVGSAVALAAPSLPRGQETSVLRFVPRSAVAYWIRSGQPKPLTQAFALRIFESFYSVDEKPPAHPQMPPATLSRMTADDGSSACAADCAFTTTSRCSPETASLWRGQNGMDRCCPWTTVPLEGLSARYITSQNRRFHRAKPNRPRDRVAGAWAAYAIRLKAPCPTGQSKPCRQLGKAWLASRMLPAGGNASMASVSSQGRAIKHP